MAGTSSIGGLVSGLDTATLIDQLMQVESQAQTRLKARLTTAQSDVKALQDLNARFASLRTLAAGLTAGSAWSPTAVTSSSDQLAATAGTDTVAGDLHVVIGHRARSHQLSFTTTAALTDVVVSGGTKVTLDRLDGTTVDLETGDGTLGGLVAALNAPTTGVRATTVRLDDGTHRLLVTSSTTGAASDFALTNLDASPLLGGAAVTTGQDAEITIGADVLHSATNTFSSVSNGLTLTLRPSATPGTAVDVSVTNDTAATTTKVKAYVDAVNDVLGRIDALSAYNPTARTAGPLAGDAVLRDLRTRLVNTVYPPGGGTLAGFGIQLDRYGKVTLDQTKLTAALAADPAAVTAAFSGPTGFAGRVETVARQASDSVSGSLTTSIATRDSGIRRLQDGIEDWTARLALRRDGLTRQFSLLETTLSRLSSQSSWLSGQISSLTSQG